MASHIERRKFLATLGGAAACLAFCDPGVEPSNQLVQRRQLVEVHAQQEAMMVRQAALQRLTQLRDLAAESAPHMIIARGHGGGRSGGAPVSHRRPA